MKQKTHGLIGLLLCFVMVLGLMPMTAFATSTITNVEASGIKAPQEGESATSKAYKTVTLPSNQGYKLLDVVWYDNSSCEDEFTGTFRAGKNYYAEVWLDATSGYKFADTSGITVLYEGAAPYFKEVLSSKARMFFTVEFSCITAIHGDIKLNLSGYEIGASAGDIEVTSTVDGVVIEPTVYVSGSSTPYTGKFEPDVQYILALDFSTKPGYAFTSVFPNFWVSMKIYGESKSVSSSLNGPRGYEYHLPKLYTDYGITVNGLKVTSENKDFIYARKDGKTITNNPGTVTYDPDTKTLRIKSVLKDPDTDKNQTIIFGNGKVNIVIEPMNDTYERYVSGKLTIRDANNVSVYSKGTKAILGNADIRKVNDVKIICDDGILTYGNLAIVGANDVFLSAKNDGVNAPVLGQSGFQCNTLTVENKGNYSKFCTDLFTFKKPDGVTKKYIYEEKDKETGIYEVKEVLTDYILEFIGTYFGKPTGGSYRIRPEAESENINRIYLYSNDGTGKMDSVLCMSDTYNLPENIFTPPADKEFKGWSASATGEVISSASISVSDAPGSIDLYAIWQDKSDVEIYDITVTDGKATVGGAEITKAEEGTTVTLTANAAPVGKVFDKWKVLSGDVTLADANSPETYFIMPDSAVIIEATYTEKAKYGVITLNGAAYVGEGTLIEAAEEGTRINLRADPAPAGKVFDKWVCTAGGAYLDNAYSPETYFIMPGGAVIIEATYKGAAAAVTDITSADITVTAPVSGGKPAGAATADVKFTVANTAWEPAADKFAPNTVYSVVVMLEAGEGYRFTASTVFRLNGSAATVVTQSAGEAKISFTFPATVSAEHVHSLTLVPATPATCTAAGNKAYYTCAGCGRLFEDAAGTVETTADKVVEKATGHSYEWVTDKEPTATESGLRHEECRVCGDKKAAVEIPATGTATDTTPQTTPATTPTTEATGGTSTGAATGTENVPDDTQPAPPTGKKSFMWLWAVLIVVLGACAAGAAVYFSKKKKHPAK